MFGGWRTQNAPGPLGRWTELCAMFAAIPAPILLGIIPRCAGKAQRGGRVGWAGDLLPLRKLRLPFTSPSRLVHGFSPHREGASRLILSCGVLGPPSPFSFWHFGLARRSALNTASVAGEGTTPRRILCGRGHEQHAFLWSCCKIFGCCGKISIVSIISCKFSMSLQAFCT